MALSGEQSYDFYTRRLVPPLTLHHKEVDRPGDSQELGGRSLSGTLQQQC